MMKAGSKCKSTFDILDSVTHNQVCGNETDFRIKVPGVRFKRTGGRLRRLRARLHQGAQHGRAPGPALAAKRCGRDHREARAGV